MTCAEPFVRDVLKWMFQNGRRVLPFWVKLATHPLLFFSHPPTPKEVTHFPPLLWVPGRESGVASSLHPSRSLGDKINVSLLTTEAERRLFPT